MNSTISQPNLPPEVIDYIIDFPHDTRTLKECSLVSKSWVPRTRKHLFNEVRFGTSLKLELWKKTFPDPVVSPAHHTRFLLVGCAEVIRAGDAEDGGWIRSFTNVTRLEVWVCGSPGRGDPGLNAFRNLSPTVKSLRVVSPTLPSSEIFDLVCSFPLLEDLGVSSPGDKEVDLFQSLTSPVLTGTLVLQERSKYITRQLLNLPNGLHFREIVWKACSEEEHGLVTDLVKRCSSALESIDIRCHMSTPGRPPTTSIDLSKAIKLKEVAFRFNRLYVIWVTESLKTITTEHNDLQQISIYIPFCLDKFFGRLAARASGTHQQWKELDKVLVQLWESRAIHAKVICNAKERRREDMCEFIEGRLPEMRRKRGIQVVYPVPPACA